MNEEARRTGARMHALEKAMREAAREVAVMMGGHDTEGSVALLGAACHENTRLAHEAATEIGGGAPDEEAITRDAALLMARFTDMSAQYFRDRFGQGGGDVFDETVDMAAKTRARAESRK